MIKCYTSYARIVKIVVNAYINHRRNVMNNCTMRDARNMAIGGILLAIAAICNVRGID
jgi:hypothetical protein